MEKDGIIIPFSAETKQGRDEIWRLIEDTMADVNENTAAEAEEKTPFDIFEELYEKQNNQEMNEEQKKLIHDLIETIWEGGH